MKKHEELKVRAVKWLNEQGFNDIEIEARILNFQTGKAWRGSFVVDVIARNENKKIIVECGGSKTIKLDSLIKLFDEVWVLPYGEATPYQWKEGMVLCQNCGHLI